MVTPPLFTLPEAREAFREVRNAHTIDFYALRRGEERATASTFRSDIAQRLALWRSMGFRVIDGPFETLQQAKFEIALDRAYTRADRPQGLLGRA
jgi:hypothetical protein